MSEVCEDVRAGNRRKSALVFLVIGLMMATLSLDANADTPVRPESSSGAQGSTLYDRIASADPGSKMTLHLRDGSVVVGKYASIGAQSATEYAARYRRWKEARPEARILPEIGAQFSLRRISRVRATGRFRAFGYGYLLYESAEPAVDAMARFTGVETIWNEHADSIGVATVARWQQDNGLPGLSTVLLVARADTVSVPLDDVTLADIRKRPMSPFLIPFVLGVATCIGLYLFALSRP